MKTKQIDIFSLEKLFVPIHLHNEEHWCLAVSKLTLILELESNNLMKSFFFSHNKLMMLVIMKCFVHHLKSSDLTDKNALLK